MALRVWLPLNGNLENKGVSNLIFKNSGATIDNNGKIGSCYSFDGTDDRLSCLEPITWTYPLSICGWFYPTNIAGTLTQYFISFNKDGNGTAGHAIGIGTLNGGSALTIWAGGATYSANTTLVNNTWYHFVVTIDENKKYNFYLNGELKTSGSCNNNPGSNWLTIGARSNSASGGTVSANYYFQGKINDIRIYDECLSQKQIKEISKGLIAHYKLTGVGANGNLANNTVTTSPSGFYDYTGKATASRFNDEKVCTSVYKIDFPEDDETYSNYNTYVTVPRDSSAVVKDGKTYTLSFKIKASKPLENYRLFYEFNNSSIDTNIGTEWKKIILTGVADNQYSALYICQYQANRAKINGGSLFIAEVKLELGEKATPWIPSITEPLYTALGYNNDICRDYSGNGYHLIQNGAVTFSTDTIRYNGSSLFDGDTSCFTIPYNQMCPTNIFTVNLWFKKDAVGTKGYESLFAGPGGFEMDTRSGTSSSLSLYMASTRGGSAGSLTMGQWNMVTMVRDGTNEYYYINGQLSKTIEAKSMPTGTYFIGAWRTVTEQNYYGLISDFRIYATPLTADDILTMYKNSAIIDNENNLYTYEFKEE